MKLKDVLLDDFWIMPQTPNYTDSGIPYITSKNIKKGIIDFTKINYISNEDYEKISKNRPILIDDILISMIGTLGEAAVVKETDGQFYGQNMFLIRLDNEIITHRYFLNYFNSNFVKRSLAEKQNQSTQKYLKANHIEDLIIPIPSFDKQKCIAEKLDKLSSIIEKRQQELDKLDELIKARFVEMFGDIYDEEKWDRKAWNDVVIIQNGRDYKKVAVENGGYPVFGTGGEMARASDYLCPANTIVVGRKGSINNPLLVKEKFWNVDTAFGVIPNEHVLNYLYFYEFCRNFDFMKLNKATTLPSTTKADLLKISINVPPIELQNQFADFVKQVDKSKVAVQKALDEAQLLFDSLMQEYFG